MSSANIQVGDKIRFRVAGRDLIGEVTEDRGPLGVGGRHLYHIVFELAEGNVYHIELPAVDIEVIERKQAPA
jgi:hypothetical protein